MAVSLRKGFPSGLRVLLLAQQDGTEDTVAQLRQCNYVVTCCSTSSEAVSAISAAHADAPFDVLLADSSLLTSRSSAALRDKVSQLPTIVMAGDPKTEEIMASIKLGVAEVLQKPLCPLKLKNIWQHTVRHMMKRCGSSKTSLAPVAEQSPRRFSHDSADTVLPAGNSLGAAPMCTDSVLPTPSLDLSADHGMPQPTSSTPTSGNAPACALAHSPSGILAPTTPAATGRRVVKRRSADLSRAGSVASDKALGDVSRAPSMEFVQGMPFTPNGDAPVPGLGMPAWPASVPMPAPALPPGAALPAGMAWGIAMNPTAVAPGITPPIFPPPITPPIPVNGQPGPWPLLSGAGPAMGMAPPMGLPAMPTMPFGCMPGALPPLPLPLLMGACAPSMPSMPGMNMPCAPPMACMDTLAGSPTATHDLSLITSASGKSIQDCMAMPDAGRKAGGMNRCDSQALLPSLEDLIADSPTHCNNHDGADILDLESLHLGFPSLSRHDSLADLVAQAAF